MFESENSELEWDNAEEPAWASSEAECAAVLPSSWRGTLGELGAAATGLFWAEAVRYARWEIAAYARWRGLEEPVLADGYDAESLAQAAFARLISKEANGVPIIYSADEILHELRSQIKHRVRWLHERRETRRVTGEWDVLPRGEDGEPVSIFDYLPGQIAEPDVELMRKEEDRCVSEFKAGFEAMLGGRQELREVFRRVWDGQKRRQVAREMGEDVGRVKALKAQIRRRLLSSQVSSLKSQVSSPQATVCRRG